MQAQSGSIVVPTNGCINNCLFCVACMHKEDDTYENMIGSPNLYSNLYIKDYIERLDYLRSCGCNVLMLTGNGEPQQNFYFLEKFGLMNRLSKQPFENIEMQTTGSGLDRNWLFFLRHSVGVSTLSVSCCAFDDEYNNEIIQTRPKLNLMNKPVSGYINLKELCKDIKTYRFNLRLSINLTDFFNDWTPEEIFNYARNELGADQITFRVLYKSTSNPEDMTPQDKWIDEHGLSDEKIVEIQKYVEKNGRFDRSLEFGQLVYFCHGMSTVIDDDCMDSRKHSVESGEDTTFMRDRSMLKYLILRPDSKLYTSWDVPVALF